MESGELIAVLISLTAMLGGVVVILAGLRYRAHLRELRHKERLAMIEKGMVPPPAVEAHEIYSRGLKQRSLSFGIIVVGLGLAMMVLISVAGGAPDVGVGVGGSIAILGVAFIVRSLFAAPPPPPPQPPRWPDGAPPSRWPEGPPPFPPSAPPSDPTST
jgi:hypothetical protein